MNGQLADTDTLRGIAMGMLDSTARYSEARDTALRMMPHLRDAVNPPQTALEKLDTLVGQQERIIEGVQDRLLCAAITGILSNQRYDSLGGREWTAREIAIEAFRIVDAAIGEAEARGRRRDEAIERQHAEQMAKRAEAQADEPGEIVNADYTFDGDLSGFTSDDGSAIDA